MVAYDPNNWPDTCGLSSCRTYIAFHDAAFSYLNEPRSNFDSLSSAVFSAMMIEGYANYLGEDVFELWDEQRNGNLRVMAKLERLHDALGVDFNKASRPVQSVVDLFKFRNKAAHPRSYRGTVDGQLSESGALTIAPNVNNPFDESVLNNKKIGRLFKDGTEVIKRLNSEVVKHTYEYDPRISEDPFDGQHVSYIFDHEKPQDDPFINGWPKYVLSH